MRVDVVVDVFVHVVLGRHTLRIWRLDLREASRVWHLQLFHEASPAPIARIVPMRCMAVRVVRVVRMVAVWTMRVVRMVRMVRMVPMGRWRRRRRRRR